MPLPLDPWDGNLPVLALPEAGPRPPVTRERFFVSLPKEPEQVRRYSLPDHRLVVIAQPIADGAID